MYNLRKEIESSHRDWWTGISPDSELSVRERAFALVDSMLHAEGWHYVEFRSSRFLTTLFSGTPFEADPYSETAQTISYYAVLYGLMLSSAQPDEVGSALRTLAPMAERERWIRLLMKGTHERTIDEIDEYSFPAQVLDADGNDVGTVEHVECATFWQRVLTLDARRFTKRRPLPMEKPGKKPVCGELYCYRIAQATLRARSDFGDQTFVAEDGRTVRFGQQSYCSDHLTSVRPVDDPDHDWRKESTVVVLSVSAAQSSYPMVQRQYYVLAPPNAASCPSCATFNFYTGTRLVLCHACGWQLRVEIRGYHEAGPTRPLCATHERTNVFLGVELEVEFAGAYDAMNTLTKIFDPSEMILKRDSSIRNGCEIASAPISYARWKQDYVLWTERLNIMREAGFRSYDPGNCGMHIHVSRTAFTPVSLLRFQELVYMNEPLMAFLAQRRNNGYAAFNELDGTNRKVRIAHAMHAMQDMASPHQRRSPSRPDQARRQRFEVATRRIPARIAGIRTALGHRHAALNIATDIPTVEVRIFRGTLNAASFWKNIETVQSLMEFSNVGSIADMRADQYVQYVREHAVRFPHLATFMAKHAKTLVVAMNMPPGTPEERYIAKLPPKTDSRAVVRVAANDFAEAHC